MRRVMCIYLPAWPLQRRGPELRGKAVALVKRGAQSAERGTGKQEVILSTHSRIRPGMPVAEALAIEPNLIVQEEDPTHDLEELQHLAGWAERFTPLVGLDEESLLLDITGCASCFHGEDKLFERALRELHDKGYTARAAIADTVGAAWALARVARSEQDAKGVTKPGDENALLPLPIHLLRLPPETVGLLTELGIDTIGQLAALPRADIGVRFGSEVLKRLDQVLGRLAEPIVFYRALPEIRASWPFEYPANRRDVLHHALERLLEDIEAALRVRNRGTRYLQCRVECESTFSREPPASADVTLAGGSRLNVDVRLVRPSRSARYLGDLLRTRLEQVRFPGPVRGITLRVPAVEVLTEHQTDLYGEGSIHDSGELQELLDRLSSRLGREAVTLPCLVPDPQPEFACKFEPTLRMERRARSVERKKKVPRSALCAPRLTNHWPLQLSPPVPLEVRAVVPEGPPFKVEWGGREYDVLHSWGPERIETGWWRGKDIHRDYYIIETAQGSRLWIFRRHEDGRWFLHGSFE